mmetsp:Transcript_23707/g.74598  ORF Transcript_23707/g.74598 Transcript_23707/m.74598 type:complete len:137 (-) Transcript_23707:260-670(-)
MWTFVVVASLKEAFQPPREWQGITVLELSASNIGPRIVFDEDGHVRFPDDFNIWVFMYDMAIGKLPATCFYVLGAPLIAMLLCWSFSFETLEAAIVFSVVISSQLSLVMLSVLLLYHLAMKKRKAKETDSIPESRH